MSTAFLQPTLETTFTFAEDEPFELETGDKLQPVALRYTIYGSLNAARDNAILVCHALSGSSRVAEWWTKMFGTGRPFDPARHCVIGTNILGSCYGTTGPTSPNPASGKLFGPDFPLVSVRDMVRAQVKLLDHLGIRKLRGVIGGSIGGMQALQWAAEFPDRLSACVVIGATALSAMSLALNHIQRQAIQNDPNWNGGRYTVETPPAAGLGIARALAMCSYKSSELFTARYGRRPNRSGEDPYTRTDARFDVAGYLDHQQDEFNDRFDANSYITISKAMDTFDLAHSFGSEENAFKRIEATLLLIGISSDWLFPAEDVRALAERLRAAGVRTRYAELNSSHGHDAFLADVDELAALIQTHDSWLSPTEGKSSAEMRPFRGPLAAAY